MTKATGCIRAMMIWSPLNKAHLQLGEPPSSDIVLCLRETQPAVLQEYTIPPPQPEQDAELVEASDFQIEQNAGMAKESDSAIDTSDDEAEERG